MSEELKPCPFCWKIPLPHTVNDRPGIRHLLSDCPMSGRMMPALEWNTRARPSPSEEALREAAQRLVDALRGFAATPGDRTMTAREHDRMVTAFLDVRTALSSSAPVSEAKEAVHKHLSAGVYACGKMSPPILPNTYDADEATCPKCREVCGKPPAPQSSGKEGA